MFAGLRIQHILLQDFSFHRVRPDIASQKLDRNGLDSGCGHILGINHLKILSLCQSRSLIGHCHVWFPGISIVNIDRIVQADYCVRIIAQIQSECQQRIQSFQHIRIGVNRILLFHGKSHHHVGQLQLLFNIFPVYIIHIPVQIPDCRQQLRQF